MAPNHFLCSLLSISCFLAFVLQTTCHPAQPSSGTAAQSTDTLSLRDLDQISVARNIAFFIAKQRQTPSIRLNEATLRSVQLTASRPPLVRSSNITQFQEIGCLFEVGGEPRYPDQYETYYAHNFVNGGFTTWGIAPRSTKRAPNPNPKHILQWTEIQALMTFEQADERLKAAGHMGSYQRVLVLRVRTSPLVYCFIDVEVEPGLVRSVSVEPATGTVGAVPFCGHQS